MTETDPALSLPCGDSPAGSRVMHPLDDVRGGSGSATCPTGSREGFWREAVLRQAASGVSAAVFCKQNGLAYSTFHRWKEKLSATGTVAVAPAMVQPAAPDPAEARQIHFAELRPASVRGDRPDSSLHLRCGRFSLRVSSGCDRDLLRDVLTLLGELSC